MSLRRAAHLGTLSANALARTMNLAANIFDVWVFQRRPGGTVFLLLHTSVEKATRYFNGGRFWQIPSDAVNDGESITDAICRVLSRHGLRPKCIWAGEHAYLIYNRRFAEMQAIGVYAAEVDNGDVRLEPSSTLSMSGYPLRRASSESTIGA